MITIEKVIKYEGVWTSKDNLEYRFFVEESFNMTCVRWEDESPEYYEDGNNWEIEKEILEEYNKMNKNE